MNNSDAKKVVMKIIKEERERCERIEKLENELKELEEQGEMCDTKKIIEIIDELNIIRPLPEYEESRKTAEKKNKKSKYIFLKISSACIVIVVSVQIAAMAAFNISLLESAFDWTKEIFLSLVGVEIQQDNINLAVSSSRIYNTLEEFEMSENIKLLYPTWLPNDLNIEYIFYSQDNSYKALNIWYDDNFSSAIIEFGVDSINYDKLDDFTNFDVDGIDYYIFINLNLIQWLYEENTYSLTCNFNEIDIKKIINNIKQNY